MEAKITTTKFEKFVWIDICHPNRQMLQQIAEEHDLELLLVKDSLERGHLPKVEKHQNYTFVIIRAYNGNKNERITDINKLSNKIAFFYNENKLITIHRAAFEFLNEKPDYNKNCEAFVLSKIHQSLTTYLEPLDELSTKSEHIEKTIFIGKNIKVSLEDLYYQKTQARITKKLLLITQNAISNLEPTHKNRSLLQDIKDQLINLVLVYDEVLEESNNILNTYISINAHKSNDVMKLLTIFSAFFLPLTFIAGIYGMNFENMPELSWKHGYYYILFAMVVVSVIIYQWFKRKNIL